jgi:hypothetical protein
MRFVADNEPAEPVQPGDQPLHQQTGAGRGRRPQLSCVLLPFFPLDPSDMRLSCIGFQACGCRRSLIS